MEEWKKYEENNDTYDEKEDYKIDELLNIEELQVSNERKQKALNIYNEWINYSNGRAEFHLYHSLNNLLNKIDDKDLINKQTNFGNKYEIYEIKRVHEYVNVLEDLQRNAEQGGAYNRSLRDPNEVIIDPKEAVWRTIIGITGLEYPLEELKNICYKDDFIKFFMNDYKWYYFRCSFMNFIAWDVGIITLYPDNKTFSLLVATDTD